VKERPEIAVDWARLIAEIASRRDREAYRRLFDFFAPRIKEYLMRTGSGEAEAEEIAQEAMIALWRKADRFDQTLVEPPEGQGAVVLPLGDYACWATRNDMRDHFNLGRNRSAIFPALRRRLLLRESPQTDLSEIFAVAYFRLFQQYRLPAQPVDATQALNLSAGVSNCKVSRGRSLS
jgi:hypothetical protein